MTDDITADELRVIAKIRKDLEETAYAPAWVRKTP